MVPFACMPSPLPRQVGWNLFARTIPSASAFPRNRGGSAPASLFSGPARRSLTLRPARSPSRLATFCTRGFSSLVASTAALIATGWNEPVPGRVYPAVDQRLHGARDYLVTGTCVPLAYNQGITTHYHRDVEFKACRTDTIKILDFDGLSGSGQSISIHSR
jgi:hypothetical protein